jgi:hypothetical protein
MRKLKFFSAAILCFAVFGCAANNKIAAEKSKPSYVWQQMTDKAAYPQSYNYPVFVLNDEMLALNNGGWLSKNGKDWTKTALPESGLNSAYQKFVQLGGAVYALGAMRGNYLDFKLSTKIMRTRDGKTWEVLSEKSNLPERVFYGATVFKDKIWLAGGFDGKNYYNDVWNSDDGVNWRRVAENVAWTPRTARSLVVFNDKIWLFGGGVIDGDKTNNPNAGKEVWASGDGANWTPIKINAPRMPGGTPVVFDGKLWMVGANRNTGDFGSAVFVSDDGVNWRELSAPWTPRGAVAAWVFGERLFVTGGKYSYTEPNGEIKFVYSNDVWAMSRRAATN